MMPGLEGPICQSCGMPLSKDEKGGGTEADGRKSGEYCSHCYLDGNFTAPGLTVEQMMTLVKGKLQDSGVPEPAASGLAGQIPNLKRWRRQSG